LPEKFIYKLDTKPKISQTISMDLSALQAIPPKPTFRISRPVRVSPGGNLYKINVGHYGQDNNHVRNYEVWATKEAVQNHFQGMLGEPKEYELKKFARRVYEDRLRVSNHQPQEKGVLISSTQKVHGDPTPWPHSIQDPEIKI
jgi:hypothetical protein